MHLFVDLFNSSHSILSFLQSFQSFLHSVQSVLSSHSLAVYFVHVFHFVRCVHSFPVLSFPSQCIPLHSIPAQSISHLSIHSVSLSFSPFKSFQSFQSFQSSSRSFNHSFICLFYMCTCIQPLCHPVGHSIIQWTSHSSHSIIQPCIHSGLQSFTCFCFLPSFLHTYTGYHMFIHFFCSFHSSIPVGFIPLPSLPSLPFEIVSSLLALIYPRVNAGWHHNLWCECIIETHHVYPGSVVKSVWFAFISFLHVCNFKLRRSTV